MTAPTGLRRRPTAQGLERGETIWLRCRSCSAEVQVDSTSTTVRCSSCTQKLVILAARPKQEQAA